MNQSILSIKNYFETFEEKKNVCGSERKPKTMLKQPCWISGRREIETKGYKNVLLEERIPKKYIWIYISLKLLRTP